VDEKGSGNESTSAVLEGRDESMKLEIHILSVLHFNKK
jgi:hypothetical protein